MCKCSKRLSLLLILFLSFLPVLAEADAGKALFEKHCAGCHTIGGGNAGGPDLKGAGAAHSTDWLVRVIVEPDKLAADKDPEQLALVKKYGFEMPNLGISREDARAIVAYLQEGTPAAAAPSGRKKEARPPEPEKSPATEAPAAAAPTAEAPHPAETVATPELVAEGKALFTGARPFSKGGAPCCACHSLRYPGVIGGTLAVDLSDHFEGMGEQGFRGVLKSLQFPIMKHIYADRPLTDEEITALVAFAKDAAGRAAPASRPVYPATGVGLFAGLIVGLTLYRRRIR